MRAAALWKMFHLKQCYKKYDTGHGKPPNSGGPFIVYGTRYFPTGTLRKMLRFSFRSSRVLRQSNERRTMAALLLVLTINLSTTQGILHDITIPVLRL